MKKFCKFIVVICAIMACGTLQAQLPKVYDESIDPIVQLDQALARYGEERKFVLAQVGGNWCPWCVRFADFVAKDAKIKQFVDDNYVYIHLNYPRQGAPEALTKRIARAGRFGYPVLVIFAPDGSVIHIQDTGLLESGEGYDREKVGRALEGWSPAAVRGEK